MKNKIILLIATILCVLPIGVHALENAENIGDVIKLDCDTMTMFSEEKSICTISLSSNYEITKISADLILPEEITLVGNQEMNGSWEDASDSSESTKLVYTHADGIKGTSDVVSFEVKTGSVTELKDVKIELRNIELSVKEDSSIYVIAEDVEYAIALKTGERSNVDDGKSPVANNTTNNTTNNTEDKESPETGASLITVLAGVMALGFGAFIVAKSTKKSRFN